MKSPKELKEWRNRKKVVYANIANVERYSSYTIPEIRYYTPCRPVVESTKPKQKGWLRKFAESLVR